MRAYVARRRGALQPAPVDAQVFLRKLKPVIVPDRPGLAVNRLALTQTIVARLRKTSRAPVRIRHGGTRLPTRRRARTARDRHPPRLEPALPVPLRPAAARVPRGDRPVDLPDAARPLHDPVKWRNPWWYPPNSRWAEGQKPIPPGPNNPLGTRWMGLSAPGVGIHGTPNPASIGYSVSHGCIRMYIPDAEWLFSSVDVGTTVFIVRPDAPPEARGQVARSGSSSRCSGCSSGGRAEGPHNVARLREGEEDEPVDFISSG